MPPISFQNDASFAVTLTTPNGPPRVLEPGQTFASEATGRYSINGGDTLEINFEGLPALTVHVFNATNVRSKSSFVIQTFSPTSSQFRFQEQTLTVKNGDVPQLAVAVPGEPSQFLQPGQSVSSEPGLKGSFSIVEGLGPENKGYFPSRTNIGIVVVSF